MARQSCLVPVLQGHQGSISRLVNISDPPDPAPNAASRYLKPGTMPVLTKDESRGGTFIEAGLRRCQGTLWGG